MKTWFSARDLTDAQLPGLPGSERRIRETMLRAPAGLLQDRAKKLGGALIHIDALPEAARAELQRRQRARMENAAIVLAAPAAAPVARQKAVQPAANLTHRQHEIMDARLAVLQEVDRMAILCGGVTRAVESFLADHANGALPIEIEAALAKANDKGRGVARSTIFEWIRLRKIDISALAPRPTRQKSDAPAWLSSFLPFYLRPQKPDLSESFRDWVKTYDGAAPSYDQARRAVAKLDHITKARGREGVLALRARQAYKVRDTSDLGVSSIYVADGTTFDSEVAHFITGRPFKPELTAIKDVATRLIVGWSAGLSESQATVKDALVRACRLAIPAIFYTDRGPGYRNEAMDHEMTGVLARLGTTPMRALPRHSWAKGNIENFQKSWIGLAKKFPTYGKSDMDKEARQAVFKRTRRDIALHGASSLLIEWPAFLAKVEDYVEDYNNRPHRALPWRRDPLTGAKRHYSPQEFWNLKLAEGAELIALAPDEAADLYRPHEVRRVRRCMVTLGTNSYFATALDAFHGQDVVIAYDVQDASKVWVRRIDLVNGERRPGALICVAEFEGNKTRYVPVSMEQQAIERRAEGRRRRLEDKLAVVEAERSNFRVLELAPVPDLSLPSPRAAEEPMGGAGADVERFPSVSTVEPSSAKGGRPRFVGDDTERDVAYATWILENPSEINATDREFILGDLLASKASIAVLRARGVDVERLHSLATALAA